MSKTQNTFIFYFIHLSSCYTTLWLCAFCILSALRIPNYPLMLPLCTGLTLDLSFSFYAIVLLLYITTGMYVCVFNFSSFAPKKSFLFPLYHCLTPIYYSRYKQAFIQHTCTFNSGLHPQLYSIRHFSATFHSGKIEQKF